MTAAAATWDRRMSTPEGAPLNLRLATGGERVGAFLLDLAILLAALIALTVAVFSGLVSLRGAHGSELMIAIWLLGAFLLRNFYFALFEGGARGATLGKRALKIRVAARDGGRLSFGQVLARNMMREVEFFLPLSFLGAGVGAETADTLTTVAGLIWTALFVGFPWLNRDRLRAGDLVAGSWVVHAPRPALLPDMSAAAPRRAQALLFTEAQLAAYGIYELQTLETVLREDNPDAMAQVAGAIRRRIGWTGREPDAVFLAEYYRALRGKLERGLLFGVRKERKG